MKVIIIDMGMSNLDSINRAVIECGGNSMITNNGDDLRDCTHIILPGVGNFSIAMKQLNSLKLIDDFKKQVLENSIPILGVCLGMQLLADKGYEGGESSGLGLIPGQVVKLERNDSGDRIPHIGWNNVEISKGSALFAGIASGTDFYFVHSYHFMCPDNDMVLAKTPYCGYFASAVGSGNIFGTQFHPEKSQKAGFKLLRNFLSL